MKLKKFYIKHKYQLISLFAHINFIIWFAWWMIPAGWIFNNVVNYLYLHRVYTHKHYTFKPIIDKTFQFLACMLNLSSPNVYAAVHMKHHKFSDTEKDPHSPLYHPWWKMLLSFWGDEFSPDRRAFAVYKCDWYKHHIHIAWLTALLFPWIIVIAHWMSKIVIIMVHKNGNPIDVPWLSLITWGEEMHKHHHEKNKHNDFLGWIGEKIEAI